MRKIWVHKAKSFADAGRFEADYYARMNAREKIETVELLRMIELKKTGRPLSFYRRALRNVVKVMKTNNMSKCAK